MPADLERRSLGLIKIFLYECKRLLWNRFFLGIILITLFYGWQVLSSITILGVSHTAPFSPWSFGDYLSRMVPILWIGALFFLTFFISAKARRVAVLTDAAPVIPQWYAMTQCAAAMVGTGLLGIVCLAEAALFYIRCFGWHEFGELLAPALITLLPPLVFALGSGWFLGQIKAQLIYVWMIVPFVCMALPLPDALGILNGSFFTEYPLSLGTLDPDFSIPVSVISVQGALLTVGFAFLTCGVRKK